MDFDEAITAHVDWKMKLRGYLAKPDGSLKAATIEQDSQCALGKWIHGEGAKHSTLTEFSSMKAEHAKFHKCAAAIVRTADSGNLKQAEEMLAAGSEYARISSSVVSMIRAMRTKAGL